MPVRLIEAKFTTPSKGAIRITLPKEKVLRNMWKTERDRIPVCILDEDGKVVLQPAYRVLGKGILSPEDEKKVQEACIEQSKKDIAEKYEAAVIRAVERGDPATFRMELESLKRMIQELFSRDVSYMKGIKLPPERDLRFAPVDKVAELATAIMLDVWQREEEDFSLIVEEVKRIKEELATFTGMLEKMNASVRSGKIPEKEAEIIRAFLNCRIRMLRKRLNLIAGLAAC